MLTFITCSFRLDLSRAERNEGAPDWLDWLGSSNEIPLLIRGVQVNVLYLCVYVNHTSLFRSSCSAQCSGRRDFSLWALLFSVEIKSFISILGSLFRAWRTKKKKAELLN